MKNQKETCFPLLMMICTGDPMTPNELQAYFIYTLLGLDLATTKDWEHAWNIVEYHDNQPHLQWLVP